MGNCMSSTSVSEKNDAILDFFAGKHWEVYDDSVIYSDLFQALVKQFQLHNLFLFATKQSNKIPISNTKFKARLAELTPNLDNPEEAIVYCTFLYYFNAIMCEFYERSGNYFAFFENEEKMKKYKKKIMALRN